VKNSKSVQRLEAAVRAVVEEAPAPATAALLREDVLPMAHGWRLLRLLRQVSRQRWMICSGSATASVPDLSPSDASNSRASPTMKPPARRAPREFVSGKACSQTSARRSLITLDTTAPLRA